MNPNLVLVSGHFKTLGGSEKSTETQGRPVVTGTVAYRETMKHMFRQNYGTKPIRGPSLWLFTTDI